MLWGSGRFGCSGDVLIAEQVTTISDFLTVGSLSEKTYGQPNPD
jgi:hypothetical protein